MGTNTSCDTYYHVVYDDEGEEDLDREELREGLELYGRMGRDQMIARRREKGRRERVLF